MKASPSRTPTRATRSPAATAPSALLTAGLLLVAANMRPVATSVGPLIHEIRRDLHLSGAAAGLLLTIPVLCFGVLAPLAPLLSRRIGIGRTLVLVLFAVAAGLVLRVSGGVAVLFIGTTLAAAGAACGNVLLPVLVRRNYPDRIGSISAFYTTVLVGMAGLSAGVVVPLARVLGEGWRGGLAIWALPALVAFALWLPQVRGDHAEPAGTVRPARVREVTRDPLTWHLTLFFGLQSWGFYTMLAWMPSIFEAHGISRTNAGLLLGLSGVMAVPGALFVPRLAARWRNQRGLALWLTVVIVFGYAGLLLAPASAPALWALLIGIGQGACFPLALTMIVLRSGSAHLTAGLSTHVQSIGYLLAAAGPLASGALHDATGSWTATMVVLIAMLVPQAFTGIGAGASRVLRVGPAPARHG